MKRYEKMSKEEIIEYFCDKIMTRFGGLTSIILTKQANKYLNQEIEIVPRIKTINTKDDLVLAREQFEEFCNKTDCSECPYWDEKHHYLSNICFTNFLGEEVEI